MCFCSCFLLVFNSGCKTTIFSVFCRYAKYSSLRNQKRVVRGVSLCPVLPFIYALSALIFRKALIYSTFFRIFAAMKLEDFEIMAPVGSPESLAAAIQAGADSIYFGIEKLNMRAHSASTFTIDDLKQMAATCREHGIKS